MKWTMGRKMALGLGLIVIGIAMFVILAISNSEDDAGNADRLAQITGANRQIKDLQLQISGVWQFMTDASLTRDTGSITGGAQKAYDQSKHDLTNLTIGPLLPDQAAVVDRLRTAMDTFWVEGKAMYEAYGRSREAGDAAMKSFDQAGTQLENDLNVLLTPLETLEENQLNGISSNLASDRTVFIALGATLIAGVMLIGWILIRSVRRPILRTSRALRNLADSQGDLTSTLPVLGSDETAFMTKAVNDFIAKMRDILVAIEDTVGKNGALANHMNQSARETAGAVAASYESIARLERQLKSLDVDLADSSAAVHQILSNVDSLLQQVANQGKLITQASTATQQMMSSIDAVSSLAIQKSSVADSLIHLARESGDRVRQTKEVIGKVARNAEGMLSLTDLINDVASRTNLLAMNASIEAAHAGAAGRGFAVVAHEIRKLAADTTAHAQQIAASLAETGNQVAVADADSEKTLKVFQQLEESIGEFTSTLKEMAEDMAAMSLGGVEVLSAQAVLVQTSQSMDQSSQEMATGSHLILESLNHVQTVSQEAVTEARKLQDQADQLNRAALRVSAFGNQNRYNNKILTGEVNRFQLGGAPQNREREVQVGIDWNDVLSVGIAQMDGEHKVLFERINALLVGMLRDGDEADVPGLMEAVIDYTRYHFTNEQRLLVQEGYPKAAQHTELHELYLSEMARIAQRLGAGDRSVALLIDIQEKMINWLLDHIAKVDHDYGQFLEQKYQGKVPAELLH